MNWRIVHIDLNAFFAQVETLRDPSLKGKPIAIGGDYRRGVLSTASYEARAFGVHSAMSVAEAKHLCPELILIEPHFDFYREYSYRFFGYLQKRFPRMERASIDEAYFDMTDFLRPEREREQLFDLQITLYRVIGLKCSIGCGDNRFTAKMASDLKKPMGLTIVTQENVKELFWPLPIEKMFGIGKKTAPRLRLFGINTIGDLATTNDSRVKKELGSMFSSLKLNAMGYGDDVVNPTARDPKSISAERTFSEDVTDYDELKEMISSCCEQVCGELIRYHKDCLSVSIKLRTPDFVTRSRRAALSVPTSDFSDIVHAALSLFDDFYHNQPIRLVGVGAERIFDRENSSEEKEEGQGILPDINASLKQGGKVFFGSELQKHGK